MTQFVEHSRWKAQLSISSDALDNIFKAILKANNIKLLKKIFPNGPSGVITLTIQEIFDIVLSYIHLHQNSKNDYKPAIDYLHTYYPRLRDTQDQNGIDLLAESALYGKDSLVKLLLEKFDYNPNTTDTDGNTSLHKAIRQKHVNVVKILCDHGADVNIQNSAGLNALFTSHAYQASAEDTKKIQRVLLGSGAMITAKVNNVLAETTPINFAEFKKLLIEKYNLSINLSLKVEQEDALENAYISSLVSYYQTIFADDQKSMRNFAKETCGLVIKNLKLNPPGEVIASDILIFINNILAARILPYDEAYRTFLKVQTFDNLLPKEIFNNMAVYFLNKNEYMQAETCSKQAIERGANGEAHYNLYLSLLNQDKIYQAEEAILQAKIYLPDDPEVSFSLMALQVNKGLFTEALASLDSMSMSLLQNGYSSDLAEAYFKLAINIYLSQGDQSLVSRLLDKAIELDPENLTFASSKILFNSLFSPSFHQSLELETESEKLATETELVENVQLKSGNAEIEQIIEVEKGGSQRATIDEITAIEIANYLPQEKQEEYFSDPVLDPVAIHQYFSHHKKLSGKSLFREKPASSWQIDENHIIKSSDEGVYKLSYHGRTIYASIDKELLGSLDQRYQNAFKVALEKGFTTREEGQNGIKFLEKKLMELKINDGVRLITEKIRINQDDEQLIFFEEQKNHKEVAKILREINHVIKIEVCQSHLSHINNDAKILTEHHHEAAEDGLSASLSTLRIDLPKGVTGNILEAVLNGGGKASLIEDDNKFIEFSIPASTKGINIDDFMQILSSANLIFKGADSLLQTLKLIDEPSFENAKKFAIDLNHLAGSYFGSNIYSFAVTVSSALEGDYKQTLVSACYMAVPTVIASSSLPYLASGYGIAVTTYSFYNLAGNIYSFCQKSNHLESYKAYRDLYKYLATTSLQKVIDFSGKAEQLADLYVAELEKIYVLPGADSDFVG